MSHRCWQPTYPHRNNRHDFDGINKIGTSPNPPTEAQLLEEMYSYANTLSYNWKKKNILFALPYWEYNLIQQNLDVINIQKNCFLL